MGKLQGEEKIRETTDYFMTAVMNHMGWRFLIWWEVTEHTYDKWNTEFSNIKQWPLDL